MNDDPTNRQQIRNLRQMILNKEVEMEDIAADIGNLSQLLADELAKRDGIMLNETVIQTVPAYRRREDPSHELWLVSSTIPNGTKKGYALAGVRLDDQHRVVNRDVVRLPAAWAHQTEWVPPSRADDPRDLALVNQPNDRSELGIANLPGE